LPAAVGLYFLTGNIVSLGQEWVIRKQLAKKANTGAGQ
jgi:membrane protein insertase Oxa1/YidC/SpoIIIJ